LDRALNAKSAGFRETADKAAIIGSKYLFSTLHRALKQN
jgi:hypothetical protein